MNAPCCSTTLKFSKLFRKSLSFTNGFINPRQWNWPDSCQYSIKRKMTSLTDTKCTHSPFSPMSWRATSCWNFSKLSVSSLRWNKMRKGIPSSVSSWKTSTVKNRWSQKLLRPQQFHTDSTTTLLFFECKYIHLHLEDKN